MHGLFLVVMSSTRSVETKRAGMLEINKRPRNTIILGLLDLILIWF